MKKDEDPISRIIAIDSSICEKKKGFPNIGKRLDGKPFSSSIKKIADAWNIYDSEIYKLDVGKINNSSVRNLGTGNPLMSKPFPLVVQHLKKVINSDELYKYPPAAGDEKAREEIVKYLKKEGFKGNCLEDESGLTIDNVIITVSTTQAFSLILDVITRPYDVIIMTGPNYGLFAFMPERINACVEVINLSEDDGWYINPQKLQNLVRKINNKLFKQYKDKLPYVPKVVGYLNMNPHNPTGKVMGPKNKEILEQLAKVCKDNEMFIIDDLIYRDLTFDRDNLALPVATLPTYFSNTITLLGLSKSYGLASFRAGCIVADERIIRAIKNKLFHQMDSAPILQSVAMMGAYNSTNKRYKEYNQYFQPLIKEYQYRFFLLKALVEGIESIKDNHLKKMIIDDISKIISDKDEIKTTLAGISHAKIVPGTEPEAGFFALIDFSYLRGKKYKNWAIVDERQLLLYLYKECKIKFIMGQSISWPNEKQIIARVTFSLERQDLIDTFRAMNLALRKLK